MITTSVIYGRGSASLAREITAQGNPTSPEQCEAVITGISNTFPDGWAWIQRNQQHAITHGWVENSFGFRRHFTGARYLSQREQAAIKREASNSPVQGAVAMLLAQSGKLLWQFRYKTESGRKLGFKLLIPIHDAYLAECSDEALQGTKAALDMCMSKLNTIPGTGGKFLGTDGDHFRCWGEH